MTPPRYTSSTFTASENYTLFQQAWLPDALPRAVIILVHGYAEHSGRYAHVAAHLVRQGYAIHAYDQRGYGRSEGKRAYVDRFDTYLNDLHLFVQQIRESYTSLPLFLFGHSMGGVVVALYAIKHQPNLAGLILSSPAVDPVTPKILMPFASLVSTIMPKLPTLPLRRGFISHDAAVVEKAFADPLNYQGRILARTGHEIVRAGQRIKANLDKLTLPFLVFHGTDDHITLPSSSERIYNDAASTNKTLHYFEGFYHETFNEPNGRGLRVLEKIAAWLEEQLASGA